MYKIAVMEGDGIGPEIVRETIRVLDAVQDVFPNLKLIYEYLPIGLKAYHSLRSTLPESTINSLKACDAGILGPVSTHVYQGYDPNMVNPSGVLRTTFDLYANIRPAKNYHGVASKYRDVDLVVVRENTEGMYADRNLYFNQGEFMPDPNTVLSLRVVTRKASERLAKVGFELAQSRNKNVAIVHKKNVLIKGCGLFYESAMKIGQEYADVTVEDYHVDAFALHLVERPEVFDVIVTTNMFGDILSDQAAGLVGGLGLAPGLNVGDHFLLAQATHGSAPELEGKNQANPIAEILSAKMMLQYLGMRHHDDHATQAALLIEKSIEEVLQKGYKTADIGGNLSTSDFGEVLCETIRSNG